MSEKRFILKTCGTTSLFHAIEPLIQLVQAIFPSAVVMVLWPSLPPPSLIFIHFLPLQDLFYSHLSFLKPHLQPHPHHSPQDEVCREKMQLYTPNSSVCVSCVLHSGDKGVYRTGGLNRLTAASCAAVG